MGRTIGQNRRRGERIGSVRTELAVGVSSRGFGVHPLMIHRAAFAVTKGRVGDERHFWSVAS